MRAAASAQVSNVENAQTHLLKYLSRISSNRFLIMKARLFRPPPPPSAHRAFPAKPWRSARLSQVFAVLLFFLVVFVVFVA